MLQHHLLYICFPKGTLLQKCLLLTPRHPASLLLLLTSDGIKGKHPLTVLLLTAAKSAKNIYSKRFTLVAARVSDSDRSLADSPERDIRDLAVERKSQTSAKSPAMPTMPTEYGPTSETGPHDHYTLSRSY